MSASLPSALRLYNPFTVPPQSAIFLGEQFSAQAAADLNPTVRLNEAFQEPQGDQSQCRVIHTLNNFLHGCLLRERMDSKGAKQGSIDLLHLFIGRMALVVAKSADIY